ncbi:hypothetical protein ACFPRL_32820 [Pseudoclavibacter helvolus]
MSELPSSSASSRRARTSPSTGRNSRRSGEPRQTTLSSARTPGRFSCARRNPHSDAKEVARSPLSSDILSGGAPTASLEVKRIVAPHLLLRIVRHVPAGNEGVLLWQL